MSSSGLSGLMMMMMMIMAMMMMMIMIMMTVRSRGGLLVNQYKKTLEIASLPKTMSLLAVCPYVCLDL
jgi:hypothetical protein